MSNTSLGKIFHFNWVSKRKIGLCPLWCLYSVSWKGYATIVPRTVTFDTCYRLIILDTLLDLAISPTLRHKNCWKEHGCQHEALISMANTLELRVSCTNPSICSRRAVRQHSRMLHQKWFRDWHLRVWSGYFLLNSTKQLWYEKLVRIWNESAHSQGHYNAFKVPGNRSIAGHGKWSINYMNPGYFTLAAIDLKP